MLAELRSMGGKVSYTHSGDPEALATALEQSLVEGAQQRQKGQPQARLAPSYQLDHTSAVLERWLAELGAGRF